MEHEIMGHTKKAYKIWKMPDKHLLEKIKEIFVEILIIVFAVTFAAFIERTREHSKEKAEAYEFLRGLKGDVANEIKQIQKSKTAMDSLQKSYTFISHLKPAGVDSLIDHHIEKSFYIPKFDTRLINGRYDGFRSSGRVQTIENDSLRNNILKLYEEDIPSLNFTETVFNANQIRLEDVFINNAGEDTQTLGGALKLLTGYKSKLIISFSLSYSEAVSTAYKNTLAQAKKVEAEIEKAED